MRLFGKVDSQINRFDRAAWLTPPFDGSFPAPPAAGAPVVGQGNVLGSRVFGSSVISRSPKGERRT